jgi:hypothetical protein
MYGVARIQTLRDKLRDRLAPLRRRPATQQNVHRNPHRANGLDGSGCANGFDSLSPRL